jgi:predicted transcriptional regulator
MHIPKINLLLTALELTHEKIAKATGLARSMVTMTISGDRTNRQTQDRITNYIRDQITTETLFEVDPEAKEKALSDQGAKSSLRSKRKRADLIY